MARCLGPVDSLSEGEFTIETASGRPALMCECGHVSEIEPPHSILIGGRVVPIWSCQFCPVVDFITLAGIHE